MIDVTEALVLDRYLVALTFGDHGERVIDLSPAAGPMFEPATVTDDGLIG